MLDQHCTSCHNDIDEVAGLSLDDLKITDPAQGLNDAQYEIAGWLNANTNNETGRQVEDRVRVRVPLTAGTHRIGLSFARQLAPDETVQTLAAAKGGDAAALDLALLLAPDANHADSTGTTALHILASGAASPQLEPMLRALAAHGARADIPNQKGYTPAHFAVTGRSEVKAIFLAIFPAASAYAIKHLAENP